jgi:GTP-binding protein
MSARKKKPQEQTARGRVVAIVGRPNVGKSAIFNRLAGRRIAIVHEQSGVTRDRLVSEVKWRDELFELIDTGGVGNIDEAVVREQIEAGIRRQVEVALSDAACVIFVTDAETGVTPLDEEVAGVLRSAGTRVIVAANKADQAGRDASAADFERFGFPVFAVSALHDRGFEPLMTEVLTGLPEAVNTTEVDPLKVAVVGRPNVGKSSYINRLLRDNRVIVSDTPGTTRDSIEVPFVIGSGRQARHYTLIDTAGMRRGGKIHSTVERFSLMRAESSIKRADIVVLVTSAADGITAQDKKIAAKAVMHKKGCVVLVNKWDLSEVTQRAYAADIERAFAAMAHVPVVYTSAKTGYNIRRTIAAVDHVALQVRVALPTSVLNKVIGAACRKVAAPSVNGKRLKIYYASQVGVRPLRIVLFVNDPGRMKPSYRAYLIRELREAFGLRGAPVVLALRRRRR